MMEFVTKRPRAKRRCQWCRQFFKPKAAGRPALYCGASCRQRAYEKRKWTPYTASDALALDLLPRAAAKQLRQAERRSYMTELMMDGVVALTDPAQIDEALAGVTVIGRQPLHEKKMWLLGQIESAYRRRKDDASLASIARWRLSQQQPS